MQDQPRDTQEAKAGKQETTKATEQEEKKTPPVHAHEFGLGSTYFEGKDVLIAKPVVPPWQSTGNSANPTPDVPTSKDTVASGQGGKASEAGDIEVAED